MDTQKWEYKVAFVEGWERVSIEGNEVRPEERERNSAFGRRVLNQLGSEGWELSAVQHMMPGRSYMVFKRPLAQGAEPDMSVVRREERTEPEAGSNQPSDSGAQVVSV